MFHCLQDGWGGSSQPWDDEEDNDAPGWPSPNDENTEKGNYSNR